MLAIVINMIANVRYKALLKALLNTIQVYVAKDLVPTIGMFLLLRLAISLLRDGSLDKRS